MNAFFRAVGILVIALVLGQIRPAATHGASSLLGPPTSSAAQELREATRARVMAALDTGDPSRALLILEGALNRGLPRGDYHLLRAHVCAAARDVEGEEQQLRGALRADPSLTEAALRLAEIVNGRGLWQEAVEVLRSAIGANPADVRSRLALAELLVARRHTRGAVAVLQEALAVKPDDARVLAALAAVHERLGEHRQAHDAYGAAVAAARGPERQAYLLKMADLSVASGEYVQAVHEYRGAVDPETDLTGDLYQRITRATDYALWELLGSAWEALECYEEGHADAPVREEVYSLADRALKTGREIMEFVDGLRPPPSLRQEHSRRRFQNSVLCETLAYVVSYLDTGDNTLLAAARGRRQEATAARAALLARRMSVAGEGP